MLLRCNISIFQIKFIFICINNYLNNYFGWKIWGCYSYFLGLQVKQVPEGIFINQGKYTKDLIKKFGVEGKSSVKIPMNTSQGIGPDDEGKDVDATTYRGIIGSLLYLTASRPVLLLSLRIQFFIPGQSTLRSDITSSEIMWRRSTSAWNMCQQKTSLQIS
ncbi:unnamed protein product [Cuscuta europaea]|uniref:Reverse transcriptase Ty1/copia-type domain-containing protein n=1 Tax=Cuscuta europaea TaxID=41803 RepID=A0A9P0YT30_CUSEU|nr:unnamed protein product [Cuscuta europaea]